jgi:hypothetical protein
MGPEGLSRIGQIFVEGTLVDEALKLAARDALLRHKREGLPVVIYRDGRAEWVAADELVPDSGKK